MDNNKKTALLRIASYFLLFFVSLLVFDSMTMSFGALTALFALYHFFSKSTGRSQL